MSSDWFRAISLPTAAMGLVAFFLPWIEVSCMGTRLVAFSGYEIASGEWWNKIPAKVQGDIAKKTAEAPAENPSRRIIEREEATLWTVAVGCGGGFLVGLFGLPRRLCLLVCVPAIAAMSYFLVTNERQFTDPNVTRGLLRVEWLYGFWLAGAAIVVLAFAALIPGLKNDADARD